MKLRVKKYRASENAAWDLQSAARREVRSVLISSLCKYALSACRVLRIFQMWAQSSEQEASLQCRFCVSKKWVIDRQSSMLKVLWREAHPVSGSAWAGRATARGTLMALC